jgi:hypothetical protein
MMSDKHIGYVSWPMPKANELPPFKSVTPLSAPAMGVAVEGSDRSWPKFVSALSLPTFDVLEDNNYYIDVYNRGIGSFVFTAKVNKPWIKVSQNEGNVEKETRLIVSVDWKQLTLGNHYGEVTLSAGQDEVVVKVSAKKFANPTV